MASPLSMISVSCLPFHFLFLLDKQKQGNVLNECRFINRILLPLMSKFGPEIITRTF